MSRIGSFVLTHAPGAQLIEMLGDEMVFNVPRHDPKMLCTFFAQLDTHRRWLTVDSYGVSDTTLEQIFLSTVVGQRTDSLQMDDKRQCLLRTLSYTQHVRAYTGCDFVPYLRRRREARRRQRQDDKAQLVGSGELSVHPPHGE
jgi:hypothetical protein